MNTQEFDNAIDFLQNELQHIRAGQATPSMVEDIPVEAYDSMMKLKEVGSISISDSLTLLIEPWDASVLQKIEVALQKSDIGAAPIVDGNSIRLHFPQLTEEKRKVFVKLAHEKGEDARITIKRVREEVLKHLKASQKNGEISEDDYFSKEKEVQKIVDQKNIQIKEMVEKKEKELLTV